MNDLGQESKLPLSSQVAATDSAEKAPGQISLSLKMLKEMPAAERTRYDELTGEAMAHQVGERLRAERESLDPEERARIEASEAPLVLMREILAEKLGGSLASGGTPLDDYLFQKWLETPGIFNPKAVGVGFEGKELETKAGGGDRLVTETKLQAPEKERPSQPLTLLVNDINDLTPEMIAIIESQFGVKVVILPTVVRVGQKEYLSTDPGCNDVLLEEAKRAGTKVETSVLPPEYIKQQIEPEVRAGRDVLMVPLSSRFSGFQTMLELASQSVNGAAGGEETERGEAIVLPSNLLSFGAGYLVLEAARLAREGKNLEQIAAELEQIRERTVLVAALSDVRKTVEKLPFYFQLAVKGALKLGMDIKAAFQVDPQTGQPEELLRRIVPGSRAGEAREQTLRAIVEALPPFDELSSLSLRNMNGHPYRIVLLDAGITREDRKFITRVLKQKNPGVFRLERFILTVPVSLPLRVYLEKGAVGLMAVRKD